MKKWITILYGEIVESLVTVCAHVKFSYFFFTNIKPELWMKPFSSSSSKKKNPLVIGRNLSNNGPYRVGCNPIQARSNSSRSKTYGNFLYHYIREVLSDGLKRYVPMFNCFTANNTQMPTRLATKPTYDRLLDSSFPSKMELYHGVVRNIWQ